MMFFTSLVTETSSLFLQQCVGMVLAIFRKFGRLMDKSLFCNLALFWPVAMDSFLRTQCANIVEEALRTPLCVATLEKFKSYGEKCYELIPFDKIRQKIEKNSYKTVESLADDIKQRVYNTAKILGAETEECLALETVCHSILQNLAALTNTQQQNIRLSLDKTSQKLKTILEEIPDSLEGFESLIKTKMSNPTLPQDNSIIDRLFAQEDEYDLSDLHSKLKDPASDKIVADIIDIIMNLELTYTTKDDELTIDLNDCDPRTLGLLKKYIEDNNI